MALPEGFNWFLILAAVIIGVLVLLSNVYILVHYQHPDDCNQAWVPKIVVVFGLWLAMVTILLFPLDVANQAACNFNIVASACTLTLPMKQLWYAVFISALIMEFFVIPFTMFYWESDSEYTLGKRLQSAFAWTFAMLAVLALVIGCAYGLAGFVQYPTQQLVSGLAPLAELPLLANMTASCIKPGHALPSFNESALIQDQQCDAFGNNYQSEVWTLRVSLVVYVIAVQSVLGWILFLIFAGWGVLAAPIDWIFQYIGRPRTVITKSEFLERARGLGQRAREVKAMGDMLRRQQRDAGRNRTWRSNFRRLQHEVVQLEEDHIALDAVFPQGEDGEVRWVLYQLGFILIGLAGVLGLCASGCWLAHIIVYMLPPVPINPMLNQVFIALDGVFPLFGTAFFAFFCAYLMVVAIKGNFLLGLNLVVVSLYPIRPGATFMSSFLVNTALVLAMSSAVIQFCATAFAAYAGNTMIFDIFGSQVMYLQGLRYVYQFNIFLYMMLSITGLSLLWMVIRGPRKWKRPTKVDAYAY